MSLANDHGATAYCGEKNEVTCCRSKVNTRTYIMTSARKNLGTDVIVKAKTAEILSATPYWRGATSIPKPTPNKVEMACAKNASNNVRGNRSAISRPTSLRCPNEKPNLRPW